MVTSQNPQEISQFNAATVLNNFSGGSRKTRFFLEMLAIIGVFTGWRSIA